MSILTALLLLAAQAPPVPALPPMPTDLDKVAPLPWRASPRVTPDLSRFVAEEVAANRCHAAKTAGETLVVDVDLAVLTRADGSVRTVIPRAIDCPTVEQFAAGLVTSMARGNLREAPEGWYKATLSFVWSK